MLFLLMAFCYTGLAKEILAQVVERQAVKVVKNAIALVGSPRVSKATDTDQDQKQLLRMCHQSTRVALVHAALSA